MGVDPRLPYEQKERSRKQKGFSPLLRATPVDPNLTPGQLLARDAPMLRDAQQEFLRDRGFLQVPGAAAGDAFELARRAVSGSLGGVREAAFGQPAPAAVAPPLPAYVPGNRDMMPAYQAQQAQSLQERADKYRSDPGAVGLTRIVKNPDGSFTNIAGSEQPGAETRYYNQYGNREGVNPTGTFAQQNATATNLQTDNAAMIRAAEKGGTKSLDYVQNSLLEIQRRKEDADLAAMEPAQRAMLMATGMREQGENQRHSLTRQDAREKNAGDAQARDREFGLRATQAQVGQGNIENKAMLENPAGVTRLVLSQLSNITDPNERVRRLIDPNDPQMAAVKDNIFKEIIEANPGVDLAAISRPEGLKKVARTVFGWGNSKMGKSPYGRGDGMFGGQDVFFPKDMSDNDVETIIKAAITQNEDRRRY